MSEFVTLEREGLALKAAGRFEEAISCFARLVRLAPQSHGAKYNLGNTLLAAGRPADAANAFAEAVSLAPGFAPAHNNLGVALLSLGRDALAAASLEQAALLDPGNAGTRHLAGNTLLRLGRPEAALPHLRAAYELVPGNAAIVTDLSGAYTRLGALLDAAPLARAAVTLRPDRAELWNNLAIADRGIQRFDAAEAASRQALALDPANAQAKYILATTLLSTGKFALAWELWESRWDAMPGERRRFAGAIWDGRALPGETLYLHAEQGLGDTIQFCRYAVLAADRANVVLAVQPPLMRLLESLAGPVRVVADMQTAPSFAAQAPLMSLPAVFGTTSGTVPASIPYLRADPVAASRWATRLAGLPGRRVGLVWAGNPGNPFDFARSIPPSLLDRLGTVAGVSWVSLQKDAGALPDLKLADWTGELADFADTAALVAGLDLVIGVDTAVVHLAGALGRPVWLLNRFDTDWRWGATGDGSAWYPTLRQFRQATPGGWAEVVALVEQALAARERA